MDTTILATLAILQQTVPVAGPEWPWWVTAILVPLAGWASVQLWPLIAKRAEADLEEEREERKQRLALEERRVKAQETTALAVEQISKVLNAMQFQIAAIERHVGMMPEGRVRARQRPESE